MTSKDGEADFRRELIVGSPSEFPSSPALMDSSPLLEEERHPCAPTLVADGDDPWSCHGPCLSSALSTDDDPVDALQLERAQIFQQRFYR